jgi:hypothetical protein
MAASRWRRRNDERPAITSAGAVARIVAPTRSSRLTPKDCPKQRFAFNCGRDARAPRETQPPQFKPYPILQKNFIGLARAKPLEYKADAPGVHSCPIPSRFNSSLSRVSRSKEVVKCQS